MCNAHLDPVWLWEWEEGAAAAISTFRTAADLCEEFDSFIFCHNEAILYKWVEELEPSLFERIQRLVKLGKWHIMGGWYLQPDCNMPSGESFVRQIILGKSYFKEKFGVEPTTAINFDPFGHTRGLVQILAKSGYDSYLFCRPGQGDMPLESDSFVWVGFDGSEILAERNPSYNSPLGKAVEKVQSYVDGLGDRSSMIVLWGVGNHGGGPSRKDCADLAEYIAKTTGTEVKHSTTEAYFADLRTRIDSLPRRANDLNPWAIGCYTSQVRIKQRHRRLENEIYRLEKMASSAALQGLMCYPREEIHEALCDLATCEFHDVLPGSSIQAVEDMSLRIFDHALEIVSRQKANAFFSLASGQPKAAEGEVPILVYSPHPFKTKAVIECEFQLADQNWGEGFTVAHVHGNGVLLPSQNEKEESNINIDWRKRVVFLADLEPSVMNRFDCKLELLPEQPKPTLKEEDGVIRFRTPEIEVDINTGTGLIDSYRVGGADYLAGNAFQPIVIEDDEDPWGMQTHSYRRIEGRFGLMSPEDGAKFSGVREKAIPSVRVIEDGPVRSVVEAVFGYGHSAACQRYMLPKIGTEIEVQTRVHWNEKDRLLKLSIPTAGADACKYIGQTAYGVQELPSNGDEAVAQKWTAAVAKDGSSAITCVNDGIYGSDFSADGLRLTLLRSPAYSGHPIGGRPVVPQDRYMPRIDQGERVYRFWLNAGPADHRLEQIDREALAKNESPVVLSFFPSGAGEMPLPLVTVDDPAVQLTAAKLAEDADDLIVRLFEPTGQDRSFTLSLPFLGIEQPMTLGAFEIRTLRIDPKSKSVKETDLLERG